MAANSNPERIRGKPFTKGQSGNPSGRPKLIKEFHEWLASDAYPVAQATLLRCLESEDGRTAMAAVKEVHDRLFGKAPQPITGDDGAPLFDAAALVVALARVAGK